MITKTDTSRRLGRRHEPVEDFPIKSIDNILVGLGYADKQRAVVRQAITKDLRAWIKGAGIEAEMYKGESPNGRGEITFFQATPHVVSFCHAYMRSYGLCVAEMMPSIYQVDRAYLTPRYQGELSETLPKIGDLL